MKPIDVDFYDFIYNFNKYAMGGFAIGFGLCYKDGGVQVEVSWREGPIKDHKHNDYELTFTHAMDIKEIKSCPKRAGRVLAQRMNVLIKTQQELRAQGKWDNRVPGPVQLEL